MRKAVRLALGGLGISLLVSCQAGPNSTGAPTPSPAASLTPSQTAGPSPSANPALTAEAERVKATFQAYQTDTAAEKATERAGTANPQAPASPTERPVQSLLDPGLLPRASRLIDPATVLDLELLTELPAAAIDQLIIQPQGAFMAVLGQGQIQLLDLSGPSANSRSAELESSAPHQGAISTDGLFLAVIGSSDSAQLWQITSRALVPVTFASSIARPEVPAVWLAFGPTSRELAIFFPIAATILSWELSPEQTTLADPKVAAWNREVHAAQLSPDWSEISWQFESTIVRTDRDLELLEPDLSFAGRMVNFGYSPDGQYLIGFSQAMDAGQDWLYSLNLGAPHLLQTYSGELSFFSWLVMPASDRLIWSTADRGLEQSALASPSVEPLAADAPVYPHMQVFAAGRLIAGQGADGSFDVIGSQSGSTLNTLPGAPTAQVKEAWAGRLLVLWIPGQTLQFWGTP